MPAVTLIFRKNGLHEFIAKYYKQCLNGVANEVKPKYKQLNTLKRKLPGETEQLSGKSKFLTRTCCCNSSVSEQKKRTCCFLGCWQHTGIDENKLDRYENTFLINLLLEFKF